MRRTLAAAAVLAAVLAPAGTASASPIDSTTGNGKAYGNCQHSSAGGVHDPLGDRVTQNAGNGGLVQARGVDGCRIKTDRKSTRDDYEQGEFL